MRKSPKKPKYPHLAEVPCCPKCGSSDVARDDPCEREPEQQEVACKCRQCGLTWLDVYEVLPLFIGKEIDGELLQTTRQIVEQAARYWGWELVLAARCALADLEGIMPEFEPSGDRKHSGWKTIRELRDVLTKIAQATGEAPPVPDPLEAQATEGGDHDHT